jgi:hypothetical protein
MLKHFFSDISTLNLANCRWAVLAGIVLTFGLSGQAEIVPVTFLGADTGVNNGTDYVLPYQLNVNGAVVNATCYDIFDGVSTGQTWQANELTVSQAATSGQFSGPNALAGYEEVAFLSQQATNFAQDQIDLQEDIWNVFAPGSFKVITPGMQAYLDRLNTQAFTNFNFDSIRFLEDAYPTDSSRVQAFVINNPTATPEPGTVMLLGTGLLLVGIGRIHRKSGR